MEASRPSKQFIIRGSLAVGVVAIVLIAQTAWFRGLFRKDPVVLTDDRTIGEVVEEDSNGNGIPNWEERLWGLDPAVLYTNGISNRTIIEDKKRSLGVTGAENAIPTNETDRLARELFTLATALGQSEGVDEATLSEIAAQFGSSIDTDRVSNRYTAKDIRTIKTTTQSLINYANQMERILAKYDSGANDVEVIARAVDSGDTTELEALTGLQTSYIALSKELIALNTPIGVANLHLRIANGVAGVADSFAYIQELSENGIGALVGMAVYKHYSVMLDTAVNDLTIYLTEYGILLPS